MRLQDYVFGPDGMEPISPHRARLASIRQEMHEHPCERRAHFPPDVVVAEPERVRRHWRREMPDITLEEKVEQLAGQVVELLRMVEELRMVVVTIPYPALRDRLLATLERGRRG